MEIFRNPVDLPGKYRDVILNDHPSYVFYIPTQFVVREPQTVVPKMGRAFRLNLYLLDDPDAGPIYLSYDDLKYRIENRLKEKFKGTSGYDPVFITEMWSNGGEDGHVDYHKLGYLLGTVEEFKKYAEKEGDIVCVGVNAKSYFD